MDRKSAGELQEHMLGTYYSLRVGLVVLGIALPLLPPARQARYAQLYTMTGVALVVPPLAALAIVAIMDREAGTIVFWVEKFAVLAFAAYWFIKTFEMREITAQQRGLDAMLRRALVASAISDRRDPAHADQTAVAAVPERSANAGEVERIVPAGSPAAP